MILLVVRDTLGDTYGNGLYSRRAGPIKIVTYFHDFRGGYLHVNGNRVEIGGNKEELYQISVGQNFTLYDPRAGKFICWVKTRNPCRQRITARKYTKHLKIEDCLFSDIPIPELLHHTHVSLVHRESSEKLLTLRFDKGGAFIKRICESNEDKHCTCKSKEDKPFRDPKKRKKTILLQAVFLVHVKSDSPCPRAEHFCGTELRKMRALRQCCNHSKLLIRSNETTD